jgi:hypothetical protein
MFGRKKRKEDELGLSSFNDPAAAGVTPSVNVSPSPEAPTSPPSVPAAPAGLAQILSGHGPIGELVAQIKADPQAFRERMMAQAQAAGVSTYVMTGTGAAPEHVDVVEELTKAADLHDKGALTDAEFEQLKKKLLGE